jgi:hypothetical protein
MPDSRGALRRYGAVTNRVDNFILAQIRRTFPVPAAQRKVAGDIRLIDELKTQRVGALRIKLG